MSQSWIDWWILEWLPERRAYCVVEIVGAASAPGALLRTGFKDRPGFIARPVGDTTVPICL